MMNLSDWFCCGPVYGVPLNHESKTKEFFFFFFQSVSLANMVKHERCTPGALCEHMEECFSTKLFLTYRRNISFVAWECDWIFQSVFSC
jgi:hypothetical protein